ncbi:MAG: UTP--glucose-1-phosphate uridylyltransferase [Gammaproteobacteria bacterium]|nr:MAG: UTP--glucose-1-phosphate uridylyltransferase [Gammaproteobacteria bacterium]
MTPYIRKAVFPVAGLGTRFLPATKASPKEMLPVVDKPLIQYAVEEAVSAGITEMIFVTSSNKRAIEDHFDRSFELEYELERRGRTELLAEVRGILPRGVSCAYVRQAEALGLGHAVLCARDLIKDEPFAVILADDLIYDGERGCLAQMVAVYEQHRCSLLAVEEVARRDTGKYGIVDSEAWQGTLRRVTSIVEKPQPQQAPSTLAVVGRYILTPRIFDLIGARAEAAQGEIQLTDAIASLIQLETVLAYPFIGKRYDCGSKLGYLQATVEYALRHPELGRPFKSYLDEHHTDDDAAAARKTRS